MYISTAFKERFRTSSSFSCRAHTHFPFTHAPSGGETLGTNRYQDFKGPPWSKVVLPYSYLEGGKQIFGGGSGGLAQLLSKTVLTANDKSPSQTGLYKNEAEKKFMPHWTEKGGSNGSNNVLFLSTLFFLFGLHSQKFFPVWWMGKDDHPQNQVSTPPGF